MTENTPFENQTALEWFLENLPQRYKNALMNDFRYGVEKAKIMEREQLSKISTKQSELEKWKEIENDYHTSEYPPFGGPFTDALSVWQWLSKWYHPPQPKR